MAGLLAVLDLAEAEPERRTTLLDNAAWFRRELVGMGLDTGTSSAHIVPDVLGGGTLPLISSFMEDYRLEPAGDGRTRVTWTVKFTPRAWTWPIRPVLIWFFGLDFKKAMDQFEGLMSRRG